MVGCRDEQVTDNVLGAKTGAGDAFAAAALGALLALVAGVGRTSLAMAREGDLPRALAAVDPRHQVPRHAELVLAVVLSVLAVLA